MSVQVEAGTRTVSTRRTRLTTRCTFRQRVSFRNARRFRGQQRLSVRVRFEGNRVLLPRRAAARSLRVR